jgi:NAD(P)H-nitrite reductase large subunit
MSDKKIQLCTNKYVKDLVGKKSYVQEVILSDGVRIPADMVIFAIGARLNTGILVQTGAVLYNRGVVVDDYMKTSLPDVYAGGDIVQVKNKLDGSFIQSCMWPDAMMQGMIAAHNMADIDRQYPGAVIVTSSTFFDIKFASCGPIATPPKFYESVVKKGKGYYYQYLLHKNILKGFLLIGPTNNLGMLRRAVLTHQPLDRALV